jgi:L-rhamnose mutarotase
MKVSDRKQPARCAARSAIGRRAWLMGAATLLGGSAASVSGGPVSQRICFVLQVKKERLAEYKERHKKVWPEMLQALRETGWHNYSLFLREDGMLIGYLETPDFAKAQAGMASKEINTRWQTQMADFFEIPNKAHADEAMRPIPEVFHLD